MRYEENPEATAADSHVRALSSPEEADAASARPVPNAGYPVAPDEPETFDAETSDDADETVADFDTDDEASTEGEHQDAA